MLHKSLPPCPKEGEDKKRRVLSDFCAQNPSLKTLGFIHLAQGFCKKEMYLHKATCLARDIWLTCRNGSE
jgi:hypothetical protein